MRTKLGLQSGSPTSQNPNSERQREKGAEYKVSFRKKRCENLNPLKIEQWQYWVGVWGCGCWQTSWEVSVQSSPWLRWPVGLPVSTLPNVNSQSGTSARLVPASLQVGEVA